MVYNVETPAEACERTVRSFLAEAENALKSEFEAAYMTGSAADGDFHAGFSDLDFFFVLGRTLTETDFAKLNALYREHRRRADGYYSALEGEIVSESALSDARGTTVYWGTGGDRFRDRYTLSGFSMRAFLKRGVLLKGRDVRARLPYPTDEIIAEQSRNMIETVRKYAREAGEDAHFADWLFLLSQTVYTLKTGETVCKTRAAEWARAQVPLASLRSALDAALSIRFSPERYTREIGRALVLPIQEMADWAEKALEKAL